MNLFADYLKALEPDSLIEVVPGNLMQLLMRGFFFADRRGIALFYPKPAPPGGGAREWVELEPRFAGKREIQNYWNPFCRALRQLPHCDAACRNCDRKNAEKQLADGQQNPRPYPCHMGLTDFTFALRVAGKPAGVLIAGQIATEKTEPAVSSRLDDLLAPDVLRAALSKTDDEEEKAAVEAALQNPATEKNRLVGLLKANRPSGEDLAAFESGFVTLCQEIQKLVDERYEALLADAQREAIIQAADCFSQQVSDEPDAWVRPADKVLEGLEQVLGGRSLFLLVRRRSHYQVMAASPRCAARMGENWGADKEQKFRVRAASGFAIFEREWTQLSTINEARQPWRKALPWIGEDEIWGRRMEMVPVASLPLSVILVAVGAPQNASEAVRKHRQSLVNECADVLAYHANIGTIFDRQQLQREEFAQAVSFVGHHLKTPLQNAFSTLGEIRRLGDGEAAEQIKRQALCSEVIRYLEEAQADAIMLQSTTRARPTRNDLIAVLRQLMEDFNSKAAAGGNHINLKFNLRESAEVRAVAPHLRMALSNLLDNAVKYSFFNQPVTIEVKQLGHGKYAMIAITNLGQGFTQEERPQLFRFAKRAARDDPFKKRPGSGIGLIQAVRLLEQGGGSLDIESRQVRETRDGTPVSRTTAVVVLPLVQKRP